MNRTTKTGKTTTDEEITAIADEFETTDFSPEDVTKIKKTRRRSPQLGDTKAEVLTFRAPSAYKDRIKERADADEKSESQVIRDALDAYL
ncbi:MAG: ribbon-helix-helix protein, CopG family [Microthrixaceae bacterium]